MAYNIREIREKKKMTQEELSKLSGVSRTTIIKLENNEDVETQVGTLKAIAGALEISVSQLFAESVQSDEQNEEGECE